MSNVREVFSRPRVFKLTKNDRANNPRNAEHDRGRTGADHRPALNVESDFVPPHPNISYESAKHCGDLSTEKHKHDANYQEHDCWNSQIHVRVVAEQLSERPGFSLLVVTFLCQQALEVMCFSFEHRSPNRERTPKPARVDP